MSTFRRRMMMGGGRNELPEGYTKYDWIKSDDSGYIQTPFKTQAEMSLKVDLDWTSVTNTKYILGSTGGSWSLAFGIRGGSTWPQSLGIFYATSKNLGMDIPYGRCTITYQARNGEQIITREQEGNILKATRTEVATLRPEYLRVAASPHKPVYESWVYEDFDMTKEIWHAVACTNELGEAGVYDYVSKSFYKSAVAGHEMIVGND